MHILIEPLALPVDCLDGEGCPAGQLLVVGQEVGLAALFVREAERQVRLGLSATIKKQDFKPHRLQAAK